MLIECVPNVSEGRRPAVVAAMAEVVRRVGGVHLLDVSSDSAHNRSVLTLAGGAEPLQEAVLALYERAIADIDLRTHRGEHPRLGAVDVVPFVPLREASMADCVALARATGAAIASRFQVPVYLYEEAASSPGRRNLEDVRRGGFEGLASKMALAEWRPDFGPSAPHPTAGASAVGARRLLIAYNINMATSRLDLARQIAARVRQSGGGLPAVKAMGVTLENRGIVQVSMNLVDYERTPMRVAFDAVRREAARLGVSILESEIVGLVPAAALADVNPRDLQLKDFRPDRILENRLQAADESRLGGPTTDD